MLEELGGGYLLRSLMGKEGAKQCYPLLVVGFGMQGRIVKLRVEEA